MCRDSVYFKSPFQMCRHERNSVTSQLDDTRGAECNLYKYGVETRHIPTHQAVEFPMKKMIQERWNWLSVSAHYTGLLIILAEDEW